MTIQSSAPSRCSLAGGGSDLSSYSDFFEGSTLSLTTNLRTHVKLFLDEDQERYREHRLPLNIDPKLTELILEEYKLTNKAIVHSSFDGVIGAGLGSSSSFAVALIGAIHKAQGLSLNPIDVASRAFEIETEKYGKIGGRQDQYAVALGGMNYLKFYKNQVSYLTITQDWANWLYPYMMLFYSGEARSSGIVQKEMEELSEQQFELLSRVRLLTDIAIRLFTKKEIEGLGELLTLSYEYKKRINTKAGGEKVDTIYEEALKAGAYGGKLCGAGQSGHLLFLIEPTKRNKLIKIMEKKNIKHVDFSLSQDGLDTRIL